MGKSSYVRYSAEQKKHAVEEVLQKHRTYGSVAKDVGCNYKTVERWVEFYNTYGDALFNQEGTYTVYMHTAPNNKVYIGQTKQNPHDRWHIGNAYRTNMYFTNAIKKYGWENFKHEVIKSGLTLEEANALEKQLIEQYKSTDRRYGYNIREGGSSGFIPAEETKEKLRIAFTGRPNPHTEEQNRHISQAKGHPVKQFTIEGDYIQTFWSSGEAANSLGKSKTHQSHIVQCCNGKRHEAYGFRWCWEEDEKPPIDMAYIPWQQRGVAKYEMDGTFVKYYSSLKEAGIETTGKERAGDNIQICCQGRIRSAYGFQWRYAESEEDIEERVAPIEGCFRYGEIKQYLKEHTKKETAEHFGIPMQTFFRRERRALERKYSDSDYFV